MGQPTPPRTVVIRLDGRDADVWAWRRTITGTCKGGDLVMVFANERAHAAQLADGRFVAEVELEPGRNRVVAVLTGAEGQVESNALVLYARLPGGPRAEVRIALQDGAVRLDATSSSASPAQPANLIRYEWRARESNPAGLRARTTPDGPAAVLAEVHGERLWIEPPQLDGEYYVALTVTDSAGRSDTAENYFRVVAGEPELIDLATQHPAWVDSAVVYGVIPRNFGTDGVCSVTQLLPYLQRLGVTAIWLSPINGTLPGDFGYAVTDYFAINEEYGTTDDLRQLVQAAHALGLRVLMDFVPNHTSAQHPYFQDAQAYGRQSAYYDYYDRDASGNYTRYFDWVHLPNLNYDNPDVWSFMVEAFCYWVREFDIDGFRVDAAWGIRERRPDFWPVWRRELQRIKPDLLLLAEAGARDGYYFTEGFDAAYDWTDELGHWAWESVFDAGPLLTARLDEALTNEGRGFHADALSFRFLNNNDTGHRFVSNHGEGMTRVATGLLLTLPGLPCVYTGDEVGARFSPYYDAGPISWEDRHGMTAYHRKLIELRRETPALHSRHWRILEANRPDGIYAYARYAEEGAEPALVVLNFTDREVVAQIESSREDDPWLRAGEFHDLLHGQTVVVEEGERLQVRMPAWWARLLRPAG